MPPSTGAKLTLGGEVRTLRFTFPALEWARDQLGGANLARIVYDVGQLDVKAIKVMVCAALRHEEKPPSLEDVGAMIEPPLTTVINALTDALSPWIEIAKTGEDDAGKPRSGATPTP